MVYWVDDERHPAFFLPEKYFTSEDIDRVIWIKSYDILVWYVDNFGMPDEIHLDHDLGEGKNGLDCAKFIVERCERDGCKLPVYFCHSSNPSGKKNILSYLSSYEKSCEM